MHTKEPFADIGSCGSASDSGVFNKSTFCKRLNIA